jgi:hypothetical protein
LFSVPCSSFHPCGELPSSRPRTEYRAQAATAAALRVEGLAGKRAEILESFQTFPPPVRYVPGGTCRSPWRRGRRRIGRRRGNGRGRCVAGYSPPAGHRWWAVRSGSWRIRRGARADDDDESTGARDRRVEQVSLQHRRMLDQEREHHRRILGALGPVRFSATVIWTKRFSSWGAYATALKL